MEHLSSYAKDATISRKMLPQQVMKNLIRLACCLLLAASQAAVQASHLDKFSGKSANFTELDCGVNIYDTMTGDTQATPAEVIGGLDAQPGQFPWLAKMVLNNKTWCGASIIDPHHLVTAAHCVHKCQLNKTYDLKEISVRVGAHEYAPDEDHGQEFEVERVVVHENYCSHGHRSDIALIRVSQPIAFRLTDDGFGSVNAICLPQADTQYEDGEPFEVAGWGTVKANSWTVPKVLQHVQLPHVEDSRCESLLGAESTKSDYEPGKDICAGGRKGESHCSGDSGSTLMRTRGTCRELVGIVSRSFKPCGREDVPGIYTRLEVYVDWINDNISND